ncbi:MAG: CvpA family protein [Pyrinomonadaceae bacterium]
MTFFDLIVIALVGSSIIAGALRGFVRGLVTGAAFIIGLVVASRGYEAAGSVLRGMGFFQSTAAANAVGFLLIICVAIIAGFFAGRLFAKGLKRVRLEWFDRALGAAFGFVRGFAVCSVLYLALTAFPVRLDSVSQARTAPALAEGARILTAFTSQEMRTGFSKRA